MTQYIIYYTDRDGDAQGFNEGGVENLKTALKWLHREKAKDIIVYKEGKDFANNQDDVIQLSYK